jgi:hypothetical protein
MRERNRGPKLGLSFDGGVAVDAGLNARRSGEAFGLSIAEFLSDSRKAVQCVTHVAGLEERRAPPASSSP